MPDKRRAPWATARKVRWEAMIEEATVDCYNEYEGLQPCWPPWKIAWNLPSRRGSRSWPMVAMSDLSNLPHRHALTGKDQFDDLIVREQRQG